MPVLNAKSLGAIEHLRFRLKSASNLFGEMEFCHLQSIDSTNEHAKRLAVNPGVTNAIVLADQQTGGKGRQGKAWHSPPTGGLWCSLLLSPRISIKRVGLLPLVASVAVSGAIRDECRISPQVKWPNDIHLNSRKVAGILVESVVQGERLLSVIVGIGVNINQSRSEFPSELRSLATSLSAESKTVYSRESLFFRILTAFEDAYMDFGQNRDASLRETWLQRCGHLNKRVIVADGKLRIHGMCRGIDTYGRLLLELDSGAVQAIHGGSLVIPE